MTTHNAPQFKHPDEMPWDMGRFKNATKFLFHPTAERPNTPNAGFLRYEPGAGFPFHKHDFAQIWYIIEGEFQMGSRTYAPGTIVCHGSCGSEMINPIIAASSARTKKLSKSSLRRGGSRTAAATPIKTSE